MYRQKSGSYHFWTFWNGGDKERGKRTYSNPELAKKACEPHLVRLMRDQSHSTDE
jgi:hypothetical protein